MRIALWCALISASLLVPEPASAQQFWTKEALLTDMFPDSDHVGPVTLTLDAGDVERTRDALGYTPPQTAYTFFAATTGDHLDGYALFDEQVGQHEPITFAVQLSPSGVVLRQEVVIYREKYGSEVRHPRFRAQFVGKTASDTLTAGKDIQIVSGATYSSRAMAIGVKRAAVLGALLIEDQVVR